MQGKYSDSIADYHQVWHFQNNSGSHVKAASLPEREPEAAEERIGGRRATTERARRSDSYTSNYCIYKQHLFTYSCTIFKRRYRTKKF